VPASKNFTFAPLKKPSMNNDQNLVGTVRIFVKWRKHLAAIVIAAALISAIFARFVMDEWYFSWSTLYPTNQYLNDRSVIFNTENAGMQMEYFGTKADINRVLTIAQSAPVVNYILDSFKMAEHYEIDTNKKYWRTTLTKKFEKNFEVKKTEREAVEISLYDTDPKTASNIVNAVVEKLDELNKQHVNESKKTLYQLLSNQLQEQQEKVSSLADTLASLTGKYGIKVSSAADGSLVVSGNDVRAVQLYKTISERQDNAIKELNNRSNIKEQMEVSLRTNNSSLYIVEKAFAADRREKPVRWLIVTLTVFITGFVSLIGVLLIEQVREIKEQL
jgi:capsular polysaccharide biosynthesis protein